VRFIAIALLALSTASLADGPEAAGSSPSAGSGASAGPSAGGAPGGAAPR
jgi:hypothetical protein